MHCLHGPFIQFNQSYYEEIQPPRGPPCFGYSTVVSILTWIKNSSAAVCPPLAASWIGYHPLPSFLSGEWRLASFLQIRLLCSCHDQCLFPIYCNEGCAVALLILCAVPLYHFVCVLCCFDANLNLLSCYSFFHLLLFPVFSLDYCLISTLTLVHNRRTLCRQEENLDNCAFFLDPSVVCKPNCICRCAPSSCYPVPIQRRWIHLQILFPSGCKYRADNCISFPLIPARRHCQSLHLIDASLLASNESSHLLSLPT